MSADTTDKKNVRPADIAPDWKRQCLQIAASKPALAVVGVLVLLVALRLGWTRLGLRQKADARAMVSVVRPSYRPMDKVLKLPANVEGIRQSNLYAHIDGYLKKIYVDEGDAVRAGQPMADIDAPDVVQAYNQAKADDDLQQATKTRYEELLKGRVISQQEYDDVSAKTAEARARLQNAAADMAYTHIIAPFAGHVARRFNYPGDLISRATSGKSPNPIFIVVDESELRVAVDIPQADVAQVRRGSPARIRVDAFANEPFDGKVTRVDDLMQEDTKTRRVLVDIRNPAGKLHAGMFANVEIVLEHEERALVLPREAVRGEADAPFVFVVKDGLAKRVPVRVGLNTITDVEILSGLSASDEVVLQGGAALTDGTPVEAAEVK
jgi:RND family efflux transporter MFP subunit